MTESWHRNHCNALTNGDSLVLSTSGDNGAGDVLDLCTGGTRTYDNSWTRSGSGLAWKLVTSSNTAILGWNGDSDEVALRAYVMFPSLPSGTTAFFQVRNGGNAGELQIMSDGKLRVTDDGGAQVFRSAVVFSTSTTYRVEARFKIGAGTGEIDAAVYAGESETALVSYSGTSEAMGSTNFDSARFGVLTSSSETFHFDEPAVHYETDSYIGPFEGDPLASYTSAQVVKVDATAATGTVTLTQTSGTTATITEPSSKLFHITRPGQHQDRLRFTLTSDADGPTNATADFTVEPDSATGIQTWNGTAWQ